jgi:hypothetical protein
LGTDTTKGKRGRTDIIAKAALAEMIKLKTTSYVGLDKTIDEDNLTGTIKGSIMLRSHKMLEEDKKNKPDPDFMYKWIRSKSGK